MTSTPTYHVSYYRRLTGETGVLVERGRMIKAAPPGTPGQMTRERADEVASWCLTQTVATDARVEPDA